MVHAYVYGSDCPDQKVLVPAGAYVRLAPRGVVHVASVAVGPQSTLVIAACGAHQSGPAVIPMHIRHVLPDRYRSCRRCLKRLRRDLDLFEEGRLR